ncbi:MAG TPA: MFS transporter [Acidimicrobiales bacterium]|jgi:MFS family permease|nr:MFS transporter [Acidimicrobiales bacterium]
MAVAEKRVHYQVTFAVLALAAMSYSLLQSLVIPALPALEHSLHSSANGVAWLLTGYLLSAAIATPILGRVGDMFGKEKVLLAVLVVLSVGTLVSALATTLPVMLLGRVIQGAGGATFPLAFGIVRDEFPRQRVVGAIGVLSAILGVGAGLGIVLSGPILTHLDYHWLFWAPLVLCLVSGVATVKFIPESPIRTPGRINAVGALLMSGWLVAGLVAVSEGPVYGWGDIRIIGLFVLAVVLIGAWMRSESRSRSPLVDMKMMRIPEVWTTNLAALLFGFGMYVMFTSVPQFVETPRHDGYGFGASVTQSGLDLLPFAVAMLLVAPLTGRLSGRFGSRRVLLLACFFSAAAYVELAIWHGHTYDVLISSGLLGIGIAMGFAAMANLVVAAVSQSQTGIASGMNTNIRNIGAAVGAGVATSVVVSTLLANGVPAEHGYILAFVISAAVMLVAAGTTLLIPHHVEREEPVEAAAALALVSE